MSSETMNMKCFNSRGQLLGSTRRQQLRRAHSVSQKQQARGRIALTSTASSATEENTASPLAPPMAGDERAVLLDGSSVDSLLERRQSGGFTSSSPLLITEEVKTSKFLELVSSGKSDLTAEEIASAFAFPLDDFQKEAAKEFLAGHSVMVCAPTGAGKTAIAEAATIAVLARGGRVIYTTPLKALSNQKLHEMRAHFGAERVGLQTGDVRLNAEGDVVIMTTEVLRNILFSTVTPDGDASVDARMRDVGLVVLDEVHYLGDKSRGSVWEEVIISCPSTIPLLCMSATVRNPEDLGGWITKVHGSCKTVLSDFRPVPLSWKFCFTGDEGTRVLPLLSSQLQLNPDLLSDGVVEYEDDKKGFGSPRGRRRRRIPSPVEMGPPATEDTLMALKQQGLLPAIWFVFSRKGCDAAVLSMHDLGIQLTAPKDEAFVANAIAQLRVEQPEAIREEMLPPLMCGIASHHAGCLPAWKSMIELLYKQGVIKVVFATGTLAAGINMPARSTVISTLSHRQGETHVSHSHNALCQMAGRAGRRGFDTEGHCVVLHDRFSGPHTAVDILRRGPEPLRSQFSTGYGMVLRLLRHRSLDSARDFVQRSFYNYLADEGVAMRKEAIEEAEQQAQELLKKAQLVEKAAGGAEHNFKAYLSLKRKYTDSKKELRLCMRAAARSRGLAAAKKLAEVGLPAVVEVETETLDEVGETVTVPVILLNKEEVVDESAAPDDQLPLIFTGLTADNRLLKCQAKHIAAVSLEAADLPPADIELLNNSVGEVKQWQHAKSSSFFAEGSGLTARVATKVRSSGLEVVEASEAEAAAVKRAEAAAQAAREKAEEAQELANSGKTTREDLRIRAEATALRRRAKEWRLALEMTSHRKESNWRSFESTVQILVSAGALDQATLQATPLGEVAREIQCDNELWMAIVLSHASMQDLEPPVLAGVVSSMLAGESTMRPNIGTQYGCSDRVLQIVESMEGERAKLYYLQVDADVTAPLSVDLRLAGLVEGWAAGLTWEQITADCTLDSGDIARLLGRTVDVLRQAGRTEILLPTLCKNARRAAKAMARSPVTDLLQ